MTSKTIPGQLTIFDALDMANDRQHIVHLTNELDGVHGKCWCGHTIGPVTDGAELMFQISSHCEPISA